MMKMRFGVSAGRSAAGAAPGNQERAERTNAPRKREFMRPKPFQMLLDLAMSNPGKIHAIGSRGRGRLPAATGQQAKQEN